MLRLYRHEVLLDALRLLADRRIDFVCDLYGDGPERAQLELRARDNVLADRVRFHGTVPPHEVELALATADLYVSVAESDGASLALLEALALGPTPVLSDIPANRAWVRDGVNGTLAPIAPSAVADALERALELDHHDVRSRNRSLVGAKADRDRNLGRLEARLTKLVGQDAQPSFAGASV
jgi:glycosyltransferase involved in cell wall biosynthesis